MTLREQQLAADADKWKALARKHEDRWKASRQILRDVLPVLEDAADAIRDELRRPMPGTTQ